MFKIESPASTDASKISIVLYPLLKRQDIKIIFLLSTHAFVISVSTTVLSTRLATNLYLFSKDMEIITIVSNPSNNS